MASSNGGFKDYSAGDYGSDFEYDSEADRRRARRNDLASQAKPVQSKVPSKQDVGKNYDLEEWKNQRYHLLSLTAFDRHKKFINDYLLYYSGSESDFKRDCSRDKRDADVIRDNHRFLWSDEDGDDQSWERQLAKKYYDKLFKEYCITDLSRYKENKIALRWRVEKEVVDGKGQFLCGNKKCDTDEELRSWEVNFGYLEHGEKKNALVKLRLCTRCSDKLNYHHKRKEIKAQKKMAKEERSASRKRKHDEDDTSGETESKRDTGQSSEPIVSEESHDADVAKTALAESTDNLWREPAPPSEEKCREDEFEEYFEDMFL